MFSATFSFSISFFVPGTRRLERKALTICPPTFRTVEGKKKNKKKRRRRRKKGRREKQNRKLFKRKQKRKRGDQKKKKETKKTPRRFRGPQRGLSAQKKKLEHNSPTHRPALEFWNSIFQS